MVSAVSSGSSIHVQGGSTNPSRPVSLDADLAKCQGQLSDWVHCVSAKTPEGKAKIDEISAKISAIKSKMQEAEKAKEPEPSAKSGSLAANRPTSVRGVADPAKVGATDEGVQAAGGVEQVAQQSSASTLGSLVDVFV